ncbi:MAG: hypothetical protein IJ604_11405 [Prevotella sp.]|nr:hypothetical protein [Prevotella sp.]
MKFFKEICHNWDKNQVQILHQHNIDVKEGLENMKMFRIYDINLYKELKPYFKKWKYNDDLYEVGTEFSKKEILSADYCIIERCHSFGYPMPENKGYLHNTYNTKNMCKKCGTGLIQKDDFRLRRVPKYPFGGIEWIYDEFFVQTDLYEKVFKPLGIESRPLRKYKDDSIMETYVQLVIPVIDEPLDLSFYEYQRCPLCGVKKYDPMTYGYFPLQEHPLPHIYKSKEYFGDGFVAYRKIFVSASLCDLMIKNKMMRYWGFLPCAKSKELSIKNEGMLEWIEPGIKRLNPEAHIIVAIPDDMSS